MLTETEKWEQFLDDLLLARIHYIKLTREGGCGTMIVPCMEDYILDTMDKLDD